VDQAFRAAHEVRPGLRLGATYSGRREIEGADGTVSRGFSREVGLRPRRIQ
jgi:hypothetical protein